MEDFTKASDFPNLIDITLDKYKHCTNNFDNIIFNKKKKK